MSGLFLLFDTGTFSPFLGNADAGPKLCEKKKKMEQNQGPINKEILQVA